MNEFSDKNMDAKLVVPGESLRNSPVTSYDSGWQIRAKAVELAALSYKATIPPTGDIVRAAEVIYNYLTMGTVPPKPAGKEGSSFQNKGGRE